MTEQEGKSRVIDVTYKSWAYIGRHMVPLECEVSHLTEGDAEHHFVAGTLEATEERLHWRFEHPGLQDGNIRVHALNSDTSPGYSSVHIRTAELLE